MVSLPDPVALLGAVQFVLDTGSYATILHPSDAQFNLDFTPEQLQELYRWGEPRSTVGIGGQGASYRLPSLLGWNILRHFRLSLNWDTRLIMLREPSD
ncbi:MAG: hypothetical protein ACR2PL_23245 [Dehalococcoidia bacterium]